MSIRRPFPSACFAALLALAAAPLPANPGAAAADARPAGVTDPHPELTLAEGMSAELVRKVMGQPDAVSPMKAPTGKAEVWAYRRRISERVDRVQVGSIPIMETVVGADGQARQQEVGQKAQYADVHYVTVEVVELLMFNDHYVTLKVTRHEEKHYI